MAKRVWKQVKGTYKRFLDPSIGRFLNTDPIRYGTNWFIYADNNPIRFMDFWGLRPHEAFLNLDEASMAFNFYLVDEIGWIGEWEWGAWLYSWIVGEVTFFAFTTPGTSQLRDMVSRDEYGPVPDGKTTVGRIHSHPYEMGNTRFSANDLRNTQIGHHIYLVSVHGDMIHRYRKYGPAYGENSRANLSDFTERREVSRYMPVVSAPRHSNTFPNKLEVLGINRAEYDRRVDNQRQVIRDAAESASQQHFTSWRTRNSEWRSMSINLRTESGL